MSDLHCRGCLCELCCPGTPAQATRVYDEKVELLNVKLSKQERWKVNRRAQYLALKRAWWARFRAKRKAAA